MSQAHVHTDYSCRWGQWFRFNDTGKTGIPIAQSISADGKRLDLVNYGAVQLDLDVSDLGKAQMTIAQELEPALRIGE